MVRKKNRYLLAEIVYHEKSKIFPITQQKLYQEICIAFQDGFGEYGLALVKSSLSVKYVNEETRMLLFRIKRGAERMLSNVFACMKSIDGIPGTIVTKHISGSIRCAQKYWIKYNRRMLTESIRTCADPEVKSKLIKDIRDIANADFTTLFKKYHIPNRAIRFKAADTDASASNDL